MKKMKKIGIIASVLLIIFILFMRLERAGHKGMLCVSRSIEQSKKIGVFAGEMHISNIEIFDSTYRFPVRQVWLEKQWSYKLGKIFNNQIPSIRENDAYNLVFVIPETDTLFTSANLFQKWTIRGDSPKTGHFSGGYYAGIHRNYADSIIKFTVYKQTGREYDSVRPLFKFNLSK